ncbi:hypothetical protein DV515_00011735, partial [Chloebia gouldiae]
MSSAVKKGWLPLFVSCAFTELVVISPGTNAGSDVLLWPRVSFQEPSDDSQAAGACSTEEVVRYEYHVLYSSSYQVPVLYFRACFLDGRPLTLDEIWGSVHASYQARLQEGPWDTITQQ